VIAKSELTIAAVAPTLNLIIVEQCTGMARTRPHELRGATGTKIDRSQGVTELRRIRTPRSRVPKPKLSDAIETPTLDETTFQNCTLKAISRRNWLYSREL
jgi:hypothetical protein